MQESLFIQGILAELFFRFGDEQGLSPLTASIMAISEFVTDLNDELRMLQAGSVKVAFMTSGPLIYIAIWNPKKIAKKLGL